MSTEKPKANRESLLLPVAIPVGALVAIVLVLFGFSRLLLSTSHNGATAVALVTAASILGVATFVSARPRVTGSLTSGMVAAVAGIAMIAGGIAVAIGPGKPQVEAKPQAAAISASSGAAAKGFDLNSLGWAADAPVALSFDNKDITGHDFYIAASKDTASTPLFSGQTVEGGVKFTYQIQGLGAGTYYFFCNIHPTTMTGTLTVSAGAAAGPTVTAKNLGFSVSTIQLTGGQVSTITFDNQDRGISHNIGIYQDAAYTNEIFKGALVSGPNTVTYQIQALQPGTYYFKCDIHPVMSGTVVVSGGSSGSPSATGSPGASSGSPSGAIPAPSPTP